jgi:hypothetical protein
MAFKMILWIRSVAIHAIGICPNSLVRPCGLTEKRMWSTVGSTCEAVGVSLIKSAAACSSSFSCKTSLLEDLDNLTQVCAEGPHYS